MASVDAHSRQPMADPPSTRAARISVSGSSMTRIGSTTASSPAPRAEAWSRKPTVMAAMPPNHTGSCRSLRICFRLAFSSCGTFWLALRCSTDDVALAQAASTARR